MIKPRVPKKFIASDQKGSIQTHARFKDVVAQMQERKGTWLILGRTQELVRELEGLARLYGVFFQNTKGKHSFDLNKWNAIQYWKRLKEGESVKKEEAEIIYTYINEIAYGWRSIESKRWKNLSDDKTYSLDFLRTFGGLLAEPRMWQQLFNRNFSESDKQYFEQIIEKNIDLSLASNIIIDTIHSIKGGEAQHVCVYEKANWPAHFENKVGLARSSESRVWYVAVTRAKESLHILRSYHEYFFPLARLYNQFIKEHYGSS
jgi:superfamily I DNA/RNA helicase